MDTYTIFGEILNMKRIIAILIILYTGSVLSYAQTKYITTIAGRGGIGAYSGDGGSAVAAELNGPHSVSADMWGNVYFVDYYNARVRKIMPNGTVVTFAGNGIFATRGDGSIATNASVACKGVVADRRGNVYISDPVYCNIRKVNSLGIISTYAGNGACGFSGDGGYATSAKMSAPYGMATDKIGNLYVAEAGNHIIRKIDTMGRITTVAGMGIPGYGGDTSLAVNARLDSPYAVAVDKNGNLYIADYFNNVIRKVNTAGIITTVAGTGVAGYSGNGGVATAAKLNHPTGVAVDTLGQVYIADGYNNTIRMIDLNDTIRMVAGNSTPGFGGDLGNALGANLFRPMGVSVDAYGSIFIADANNQRIRKVYDAALAVGATTGNAQQISVYPNPGTGSLNINGLLGGERVNVYDAMGRNIAGFLLSHNAGETLTLDHLPAGLLMIKIQSANGAELYSGTVVEQP